MICCGGKFYAADGRNFELWCVALFKGSKKGVSTTILSAVMAISLEQVHAGIT